jgi:hypothetical protein
MSCHLHLHRNPSYFEAHLLSFHIHRLHHANPGHCHWNQTHEQIVYPLYTPTEKTSKLVSLHHQDTPTRKREGKEGSQLKNRSDKKTH